MDEKTFFYRLYEKKYSRKMEDRDADRNNRIAEIGCGEENMS